MHSQALGVRMPSRIVSVTLFLLMLTNTLPAAAQSVPAAFLLYPNYRGLLFDDRPEIAVEAPAGATITVTDRATGASVLNGTVPGSSGSVTIPATGLTANRPYVVTARSGGTVIGTWDVTPLPAASRSGMNISFDPGGRLLIKGKPTFVLGVYDSGLPYFTDVGSYEQMLFAPGGRRQLGNIPLNMYLNYHYGQTPLNAVNPLMDALKAHGMTYLQTANCFDKGSYTRIPFSVDQSDGYVTQFGAHPASAGYYIMDECVDALVPETVTHHNRLKSLDSGSMTLATTLARGYIDPRKWTEAADVLASDPYPLFGPEPAQGYSHFTVADYIAQTTAAVRGTRPVFSVLQFFKFTSDSRWPTAAEQRAHAIMSIVEGAQGLFWWEIGANGLQRADAATIATQMQNLRTLVTELAALNDVLVASDAPGALAGNSTAFADALAGRKAQLQYDIGVNWLYSDKQWHQAELSRLNAGDTSQSPMLQGAATIRTKVKVVGGKGYVFAYNYTNKSTPVTFTWNTAPGAVAENKSGKTYPVSGNAWSDTFGPYESRIYVIANGGSGGTTPGTGTGGTGGGGTGTGTPALTVGFANPASGATVSGSTTVTVTASGASGYTYTVKADGAQVYSGTNPTFSLNTALLGNGSRTLVATVTGAGGQTGTASITVNVSNGGGTSTTSPAGFTASITYPNPGAEVSGMQSVGLATTAPWGQTKTFELKADGTVLASQTSTGTTFWYQWDSRKTPDGARTLTLSVSANGQTATVTRPVTVKNGAASTAPTSSSTKAASFTAGFVYPADGAVMSGVQTVGMQTSAAWGVSKTFAIRVNGAVVWSETTTGTTVWKTFDTATAPDGLYPATLEVTVGGERATSTRTFRLGNGVL